MLHKRFICNSSCCESHTPHAETALLLLRLLCIFTAGTTLAVKGSLKLLAAVLGYCRDCKLWATSQVRLRTTATAFTCITDVAKSVCAVSAPCYTIKPLAEELSEVLRMAVHCGMQ